jgi:hypothetical protein
MNPARISSCSVVLIAFCSIAVQAWAQGGKPKNYDEYLRMTAELQAQRAQVLQEIAQNGKAMLDLRGLSDVLMAAVPWPTPIDLANKGNDLKDAQEAYQRGDVSTAMNKFYDVLSWYVLKFATVGGYEFGPLHDISKAATQFTMEWQGKVNQDNELASQLAAIALQQAELDRLAESLPLIDTLPPQARAAPRSQVDDVDSDSAQAAKGAAKPKDLPKKPVVSKQSQIQACQASWSACNKGCGTKDQGTIGALIASLQEEARCTQRCAASQDSCLANIK